jgi:hypothetical protein
MITGSKLGIPSKISLLKDLAGDILEGGMSLFERGRALRGNLEIIKEPKEPLLLSNS